MTIFPTGAGAQTGAMQIASVLHGPAGYRRETATQSFRDIFPRHLSATGRYSV